MALEQKTNSKEKIEIVGDFKHIQIRSKTWVEDNGVMVGKPSFSRRTLAPTDNITGEDSDIQSICNAVWTDEIKAAYQTYLSNL